MQNKPYSAPGFEFIAFEQPEAIAISIGSGSEDDRDAVIVW
ncbi:MAG: hypothetical protein ACI4K9_01705 [Candidatus Fimenecus sp.]